jgi:SAM-dependent methyltransferase
MLQRDKLDGGTWSSVVSRVDRLILDAVRRTAQAQSLDVGAVARGYDELGKLRHGAEPDYSAPGISIAYALAYLPHRVSSVLGVLSSLALPTTPRRVLDLGSGSGAVAIALDCWSAGEPIEIIALDPSDQMRMFAHHLTLSDNVSMRQINGRIEEVLAPNSFLGEAAFDLIISSASLMYGVREASRIPAGIARYAHPGARFFAIAPVAKEKELLSIWHAFVLANWTETRLGSSEEFPPCVREVRRMSWLSDILSNHHTEIYAACSTLNGRNLLGHQAFPVRSWNSSRSDLFMSCCRRAISPRPVLGGHLLPLPQADREAGDKLPEIRLFVDRGQVCVSVKPPSYVTVETAAGLRLHQGAVNGIERINRPVPFGTLRASAWHNGRVVRTVSLDFGMPDSSARDSARA